MAKRPVFEEVGNARPRNIPAGGSLIDTAPKGARKAIRAWLVILFVMVAAMIALGGATRLTGSGLSITEWRPVTGMIPPTSAAEWEVEFEKYKQIPQYAEINPDMDMAGFQRIYWWEWWHRQLGRAIGLVWALGFFGFLATKRMPAGWSGRLLGLGALGGLQGAVGWWMVHSGVATQTLTHVASYRLATHLGLAFGILGLITWYALQLSRSEADLLRARRAGEVKLFKMSTGLMHFAFLQILLGALVAGIDAGRHYTGWPTMGGYWIPPTLWEAELGLRNFFENAAMVQFVHRMAGYLLTAFAVVVWLRGRKSPHRVTRGAFSAMLAMVAVQIGLGIVTIIHGSPLELALAHQVGAMALFVLVIRARHHARYPFETSVREGVK